MVALLALLISSALPLQAGGAPPNDQEIVIRETPRPLGYVVSTETVCGGVRFQVEIGTDMQGSRIVRATADGRDLVLRADGGELLASRIGKVRVIGLRPSACEAASRSIGLAVTTYDAQHDAIPGQGGEATIAATAALD